MEVKSLILLSFIIFGITQELQINQIADDNFSFVHFLYFEKDYLLIESSGHPYTDEKFIYNINYFQNPILYFDNMSLPDNISSLPNDTYIRFSGQSFLYKIDKTEPEMCLFSITPEGFAEFANLNSRKVNKKNVKDFFWL